MKQIRNSGLSFLGRSKEHGLVWFFCFAAAIHIFVFSAALPFFNNVDEPEHFDLVVKYSHLHIPKGPEYLSDESLQYIVVYDTWEYLYSSDSLSSPPWTQPMSQIGPVLLARETRWHLINYESPQPPLYYLMAGAWWKFWAGLGFHDAFLLYMVRFLNVLIVVTLVWLGWFTARLVFPEKIFVRIGVAVFLALMPQSIFYSISNDVLSAICFGAAFFCLLKLLSAEILSMKLAIATGLALAATFLSKSTNLPLLIVSATVIGAKIWTLLKQDRLKASLPALGVMFISAALPVAAWMVWCKIYFGDFIGSTLTMHLLGWTIKPISEWWHHPIFSADGIWTYWLGQFWTLWEGELMWHGRQLVFPSSEVVYAIVSAVLLIAAATGLLPRYSKVTNFQRRSLWLGYLCFASSLGFFAFLSIIYDFHNCIYPSREHPFFHSGRTMLGALIPFLLLIVYGLDRLLDRVGNIGKFVTLATMILAMVLLEITTDWPVFFSRYNWFHI